MKNPIQPLAKDDHGVLRFKRNEIVCYLLEQGRKNGVDMNTIAEKEFSQDDREQFAQLIGYSLSGFSSLSYAKNETCCAAEAMWETDMDEKDARLLHLEGELDQIEEKIRDLAATAFNIHPGDLK